jgi:hypothetical protein
MSGTVLKYLPDEKDVSEFQTSDQSFKLTSQRLIFEGESKRLFVLPGGRVLIAAMLRDVDVAFLGRQHVLPTLVGLFGAGILLLSLTTSSMLGVVLGAVVVAAWYFLGGTVLEFRVKGCPIAAMSVTSFGSMHQELAGARDFVDKVFDAKEQCFRLT